MTSAPQQLIIHVGDPKTGTSSIQKALQMDLVTSGAGRIAGFLDSRGSANAVAIARCFHGRDPKRVKAAMRHLNGWITQTQAEFLVLSSEFFIDATPGVLRRALLRRHQDLAVGMKVIAYGRPHAGRILSAYAERVKCGYTLKDFPDWLPHFIAGGSLNYALRFGKWRAAFGDGFILRPFVRSELRGGDAVADFFGVATGDPGLAIRDMEHENQSLSLRTLSGLRLFNCSMDEAGISAKQRIPLARTIARAVVPHPSDLKPFLDQGSIALIARSCREDARAVDEAYFGKPVFAPEFALAERSGAEQSMSLMPDAYFTAGELAALSDHAAALQSLLKSGWTQWHDFYAQNRMRLNVGLAPSTENGGEIQQRLEELGRLFSGAD